MSESKKSKKHGRNKATCQAYRTSQRGEFNKARRLKRHLRKHPESQVDAWKSLLGLDKLLYAAQRKDLKLTEFITQYKPAGV